MEKGSRICTGSVAAKLDKAMLDWQSELTNTSTEHAWVDSYNIREMQFIRLTIETSEPSMNF